MAATLPLINRRAQLYVALISKWSYKEIAYNLKLTPNTVKIYSSHLRQALNFASREELQGEVIRHALEGNLWPYLESILGENARRYFEDSQALMNFERVREAGGSN